MGECLIMRRGGESYELPVLDASYPKDAAVTASPGGSASFSVRITTPGRPAEYAYQWYRNGAAVSGANAATLTLTALTAAATYSVYCKVTNKAGSVSSRTATLTVRSYLPAYTYTGSHQLIDDGNFNWRLKLRSSGNLTFTHLGSGASAIDVFLVGGGGGGVGSPYGNYGGSGGGGGYTRTDTVTAGLTAYSVVIGAGGAGAAGGDSPGGSGGVTSAFNHSAAGGNGAAGRGGNGGSGGGSHGGVGGSDGSDGGGVNSDTGAPWGGAGQHTTTREFGESSGALYAGGGGGAGSRDHLDDIFAGGSGGGGAGGGWGTPGTDNTGGGGGGVGYTRGNGSAGGSGIVVIRNHR